jgi:hypothetical protein
VSPKSATLIKANVEDFGNYMLFVSLKEHIKISNDLFGQCIVCSKIYNWSQDLCAFINKKIGSINKNAITITKTLYIYVKGDLIK